MPLTVAACHHPLLVPQGGAFCNFFLLFGGWICERMGSSPWSQPPGFHSQQFFRISCSIYLPTYMTSSDSFLDTYTNAWLLHLPGGAHHPSGGCWPCDNWILSRVHENSWIRCTFFLSPCCRMGAFLFQLTTCLSWNRSLPSTYR